MIRIKCFTAHNTYGEWKVEGLSDSKLARSDIVKIPEEDNTDEAEEDVTQPDMAQGEVVRQDHRFEHIGPCHPLGAIRLLEPGHDEAELEAKVGNQGNCHLGYNSPGKIVVRSDEYCRQPGSEMKNNSKSNRQIGCRKYFRDNTLSYKILTVGEQS